jgi:hypothetical protein
LDLEREELERVDPSLCGNLESWLVPHREAQSLLDRARAAIDPVVVLAPDTIAVHPWCTRARCGCVFGG